MVSRIRIRRLKLYELGLGLVLGLEGPGLGLGLEGPGLVNIPDKYLTFSITKFAFYLFQDFLLKWTKYLAAAQSFLWP